MGTRQEQFAKFRNKHPDIVIEATGDSGAPNLRPTPRWRWDRWSI